MNSQNESNNKRFWLFVSGIGLCALAVVFLILFLLQGETKYSDSEGSTIKTQSITCAGDDITYPFQTASKSGAIKIHTVLNDDKLKSVSLVYKLYYSDPTVIEQVTTRMNADMNRAFGENGLGADALGVTYSPLSDSVQMTLYAERKNLNSSTAKFFLLEGSSGDYKKDEILQIYGGKNLDCALSE